MLLLKTGEFVTLSLVPFTCGHLYNLFINIYVSDIVEMNMAVCAWLFTHIQRLQLLIFCNMGQVSCCFNNEFHHIRCKCKLHIHHGYESYSWCSSAAMDQWNVTLGQNWRAIHDRTRTRFMPQNVRKWYAGSNININTKPGTFLMPWLLLRKTPK